jgi:hypothetical protein
MTVILINKMMVSGLRVILVLPLTDIVVLPLLLMVTILTVNHSLTEIIQLIQNIILDLVITMMMLVAQLVIKLIIILQKEIMEVVDHSNKLHFIHSVSRVILEMLGPIIFPIKGLPKMLIHMAAFTVVSKVDVSTHIVGEEEVNTLLHLIHLLNQPVTLLKVLVTLAIVIEVVHLVVHLLSTRCIQCLPFQLGMGVHHHHHGRHLPSHKNIHLL